MQGDAARVGGEHGVAGAAGIAVASHGVKHTIGHTLLAGAGLSVTGPVGFPLRLGRSARLD